MFGQRLKEPVAVKAPSEGLEFRFKSPVINNEKYENKVKEAAAEYGEEVDVPGYTVDKELTYLTVDFDYDTDEIVLTLNPNVETVPREDFVEVFLDYGMYSLKVLFHITQEGIKTEVVPIKEEDKTEVVPTKEDKTEVVLPEI